MHGGFHILNGGYVFDGNPMSNVNEDEVNIAVAKSITDGVRNFVICGVFSAVNSRQEIELCYK